MQAFARHPAKKSAFQEPNAMYRSPKDRQITLFDFNQTCGMQLDCSNEWIILADKINWASMEEKYSAMFPSSTGHPAKPLRMALGALIIQKRKKLSDRALVKEIGENPYLQYFIGANKFSSKCPFEPTSLVAFRKRLNAEFLMEANDLYLKDAPSTPEHAAEKPDNLGTAILDATCSPSNIKFPQDFVLLNDAREKLEAIIDSFHENYHPWPKPRTYRKVARKNYLALAKAKKRPARKIRAQIRRELGNVKRDLRYIEQYISAGYAMDIKFISCYQTILKLYEQQKYMFDNKTHHVENRIVSISQPWVRPIVRGKAKAPVEFGAKYDVSVDEKGHARLEHVSFDPYNESTIFKTMVENYRKRNGHYPGRVLVDQIYRTRENRAYCKEHGIRMSGPKLGRPEKNPPEADRKNEYQDNTDRIEVERFFSLEKRCSGAALITTKLKETSLASIALSVLVTNLFAIPLAPIFLLFIAEDPEIAPGIHYALFCPEG